MASFFKKSQEQGSEAAVSSIPVPPADSALVIDLPEGQKLVLGKMDEGTVIEVATWRGTGRPDSRTNRLMLGVSFGGSATPESQSDSSEVKNLSVIEQIQHFIRSAIFSAIPFVKEGLLKVKRQFSNKKSSLLARRKSINDLRSTPFLERDQDSSLEEDFDIDQWLNTVRSKSRVSQLAGIQESEQKTEDNSKSGTKRTRSGRPPSKKSAKKKPTKK